LSSYLCERLTTLVKLQAKLEEFVVEVVSTTPALSDRRRLCMEMFVVATWLFWLE
jgi:hypothetical protein